MPFTPTALSAAHIDYCQSNLNLSVSPPPRLSLLSLLFCYCPPVFFLFCSFLQLHFAVLRHGAPEELGSHARAGPGLQRLPRHRLQPGEGEALRINWPIPSTLPSSLRQILSLVEDERSQPACALVRPSRCSSIPGCAFLFITYPSFVSYSLLLLLLLLRHHHLPVWASVLQGARDAPRPGHRAGLFQVPEQFAKWHLAPQAAV